MAQMKWSMGALILWFVALFNIERLHEPINIASFVYLLSAAVSLGILAVPHLKRAALAGLVAGAVVLLLALKHLLGYGIMGSSLPLTVTEGLAVSITIVLTRRVAGHVDGFEDAVMELAGLQWSARSASFQTVEEHVYREVSRARRFERPLTVVSLRPEIEPRTVLVHRLIEEVQRRNAGKLLDAQILKILDEELHDCDVAAKKDGHFVLALMETDRSQAQAVIDRVVRRVSEELGISLRLGLAVFPDQEVTLAGLLDRAEDGMRRSAERPSSKVKRENGRCLQKLSNTA